MPAIRGAGLPTTLGRLVTNWDTLAAGQTRVLPAGPNLIHLGQYSYLQVWDPVLNNWRNCQRPTEAMIFCECDGVNQRLANLSGCPVGAVLTNAGSGYTSAPAVAANAGGSSWVAITSTAAHMVNTSQSVVGGGSGYTIPPRMVVSAPPAPGVPCTAHCTLSGGVVNAIVVDNQGAGYTSPPSVTFFTDPNDLGTSIVPATNQTFALTGAGTIGAVLCTNPGLPQTSVPTLAFTGGGGTNAAATTIMNFATTGYTVSNGGSFHAGTIIISGSGMLDTSVVAANTNPSIEKGIIRPRAAKLTPALSGNAIVASASTAPLTVEDWGIGFQLIPAAIPIDGTGLGTTVVTTLAFTVGGQTDFVMCQPLTG